MKGNAGYVNNPHGPIPTVLWKLLYPISIPSLHSQTPQSASRKPVHICTPEYFRKSHATDPIESAECPAYPSRDLWARRGSVSYTKPIGPNNQVRSVMLALGWRTHGSVCGGGFRSSLMSSIYPIQVRIRCMSFPCSASAK